MNKQIPYILASVVIAASLLGLGGIVIYRVSESKRVAALAFQETARKQAEEVARSTSRRFNPEPIRILAWSIDSGGSDSNKILQQLQNEMPTFEVLALAQVSAKDIELFSNVFDSGGSFAGTTGGNDRLLLAWADRYEVVEKIELLTVQDEEFAPGKHRAPLAVHLRDLQTAKEFWVLHNHLARSNENLRNKQVDLLVQWARQQEIPIVAVGNYNMDYDITARSGNTAYDNMIADKTFVWIQPDKMIDTNWADPDGDGVDNFPNSMLDLVFVAGLARDWDISSEVIVREGDFPDDATTSDHRPIAVEVR